MTVAFHSAFADFKGEGTATVDGELTHHSRSLRKALTEEDAVFCSDGDEEVDGADGLTGVVEVGTHGVVDVLYHVLPGVGKEGGGFLKGSKEVAGVVAEGDGDLVLVDAGLHAWVVWSGGIGSEGVIAFKARLNEDYSQT